jgi:hypothetical protein
MGPGHHKLKPTLALALALGAIAPAAASARQELNPPPTTTTPSQPPVQIVRVSAPGGFDWGDAGIGAAGALGLSTLAIGSGLVIAGRRHQTPGTPEPEHRATPHQRDAGDASPGAHPKAKSVSDQQEAVT